MRLIAESTEMLERGFPLNAPRTLAKRGRPVRRAPRENTVQQITAGGRICYEVIDRIEEPEGIRQVFDSAEQAAWAFAEQVGWVALREAVNEHRYEWLFPVGSTLDWPSSDAHRRVA